MDISDQPPVDLHRSRSVLGITLKVMSTAVVAGGFALVKVVSDRYPLGQIVFMRGLFGMIPLFLWLAATHQLRGIYRTNRIAAHFGRSAVGATAIACQFAAVSLMPLTDASAIMQASPLILVALAALILGETVRFVRWTAVAAGLCGMLIIVFNYVGFQSAVAETNTLGVVAACGAALLMAVANITVRTMTGFEPAGTIVFYFSIFIMLFSLPTIAFGWAMPDLFDLLVLILVGLAAGTGQILLTLSLRYGDASLIGVFDYTTLLWALILGWLMFNHLPSATVLTGAAIIVLSGLIVLYRERRARPNKKS